MCQYDHFIELLIICLPELILAINVFACIIKCATYIATTYSYAILIFELLVQFGPYNYMLITLVENVVYPIN